LEGLMSAVPDMEAPGEGLSRRALLGGGATGAAAVAVVAAGGAEAATRHYPRLRVIALSKLRVNRAHTFDYPLKDQSSVLLDLGHAVPRGVGPKRSIVAYSILCQHMGCPVEYRRATREFVCPCHQTQYDPERLGAIVQGVALRALPQVQLEIRDGAVWAVGVDGLIYGYRTNLAPGRRVGGRS
jgi:arsenite oxidase small subunit